MTAIQGMVEDMRHMKIVDPGVESLLGWKKMPKTVNRGNFTHLMFVVEFLHCQQFPVEI
jgi:hypothetical protein